MFDGVTLPFSASELLTGTFEFITILGPLIILGIAVMFTPRIVAVIKNAIGSGRGRV